LQQGTSFSQDQPHLSLSRLFVLLEAAQKLLLVAESFHHQRCVLKVEAFLHTRAEER